MNTILVRRTALAIIVGVATVGTVSAQSRTSSAQGRTPMRFAALDVNKDGVITRQRRAAERLVVRGARLEPGRNPSGDEVRQGATPPSNDDQPTGSTGRCYDDWTVRGFVALNRNRGQPDLTRRVAIRRRHVPARRRQPRRRPDAAGVSRRRRPFRNSGDRWRRRRRPHRRAPGIALASTVWTRTTTTAASRCVEWPGTAERFAARHQPRRQLDRQEPPTAAARAAAGDCDRRRGDARPHPRHHGKDVRPARKIARATPGISRASASWKARIPAHGAPFRREGRLSGGLWRGIPPRVRRNHGGGEEPANKTPGVRSGIDQGFGSGCRDRGWSGSASSD